MIEKIRYELLPHNFSLNKDLSNNLNKNRLPIVAWAVSATLAGAAGNSETLGSKFSHETARAAGVLMLLYKGSHISHAHIIFIRKIRIDFL